MEKGLLGSLQLVQIIRAHPYLHGRALWAKAKELGTTIPSQTRMLTVLSHLWKQNRVMRLRVPVELGAKHSLGFVVNEDNEIKAERRRLRYLQRASHGAVVGELHRMDKDAPPPPM